MKKLYSIILTIGAFFALTSCMGSYTIQGSSNLSVLDGRMLFLKTLKNGDVKNLDSCDVVHGEFQFHGSVDTTRMAFVYMENEMLTPIVLESGDITLKADDSGRSITGTPLNEKLDGFLKAYNKIEGEEEDLVHQHDQAILGGQDMNQVILQLQDKDVQLTAQKDSLVTNFVTENYDNALGPGVFLIVTSSYQYPQLTPWIEDIMSKATDNFKNDSYVKDYYEKAKENQQIMNGLREAPVQTTAPTYTPAPQNAVAAPTPNQMAQPSQPQAK